MPNRPYSDPNLEWVSIRDFTPGIYRYSRGSTPLTYTPEAPLGSASHAYRCYARPQIGLAPVPSYALAETYQVTNATAPSSTSIGDMRTLAGRGGGEHLVTARYTQIGNPATAIGFNVTRKQIDLTTFNGSIVYSSSGTTFLGTTLIWPVLDYGVFQDPSTLNYARCVIGVDPVSITTTATNGTWFTVRGWQTPATPADSSSGTFPLLPVPYATYPRAFYHGNRMGIWQVESAVTADSFWASDEDVLQVSNLLNPTTINTAGTFFPEMGTAVGSWGSISTGEFVGVYFEGGAFLIYGDLFAPSQVVKLPGVTGTAGMIAPGCLTPAGLIYGRNNDGAYMWNGDNRSQKISNQIPDDQFARTKPPGFQQSSTIQTSMAVYGQFVIFPNNWVYDTLTGSWWLIEDPSVLNCQVWCAGTSGLYGSPGYAVATAGNQAQVSTYYWSMAAAASSYRWISNPIPVTQDSLVTIQLVEIVASNPTATSCTVTITPNIPAGQQPLQQQSQSQPVTFTIPAHTVAYRASQRLGYSDYNIQLQVDAANTNTNNAAPVLHELNIGYATTRVAGVQ